MEMVYLPKTITDPTTNPARRKTTSLIRHNALPLPIVKYFNRLKLRSKVKVNDEGQRMQTCNKSTTL